MTLRSVWDTQQAMDETAEQVEDSTHVIDLTDPATCPACGAAESTVEVDYSIRWNRIAPAWGEYPDVDVHQQDAEYETIGYMCIACHATLAMPDNARPNWVS